MAVDSPIDIRLAGPEDLEGALACYQRNGYSGGIAAEDRAFIAVCDGQIVGVVRLVTENGLLLLRGMFIDEAHRRRGLGRRMLAALEPHIDADCWMTCFGRLVSFYGEIGFEAVPDEQAPPNLSARAAGYRKKHGDQQIMFRPLPL